MPKQDLPQSAQKKKNFKMPDIYIILGIFILLMAVLTYIVPSGQYDRHVVDRSRCSKSGSRQYIPCG